MTEFPFSSKTLRVFDTKSGYISCCWETIGHRGFGFNLELNQNMSRFCSDFFQIMADQICIWPWSSVETLVLSFCKKRPLRDYVRKWVVNSLFFNSDLIYRRSFDTSWIFQRMCVGGGQICFTKAEGQPNIFPNQTRYNLDFYWTKKESLVWKHIGLSLSHNIWFPIGW